MTPHDVLVLAVLRAGDALDLEALVLATGLPREAVERALERLEAAGVVEGTTMQ